MATVIATINLKGGVGKTTTTAALAEFMSASLAAYGRRVLLVDLDPQTNLTTMMIGEQRWQEVNDRKQTVDALFASALDADLPEFDVDRSLVRGVSPLESVRGIDLLASSLDLMETQEEMNAWQSEVPGSLEPPLVLRAALANVRSNYDFILLDCAPNLGIVTANGLMMADAYVVPAIPDVRHTAATETGAAVHRSHRSHAHATGPDHHEVPRKFVSASNDDRAPTAGGVRIRRASRTRTRFPSSTSDGDTALDSGIQSDRAVRGFRGLRHASAEVRHPRAVRDAAQCDRSSRAECRCLSVIE